MKELEVSNAAYRVWLGTNIAALKRFGRHRHGCLAGSVGEWRESDIGTCTCGLAHILGASDPAKDIKERAERLRQLVERIPENGRRWRGELLAEAKELEQNLLGE